MTVGPSTGGTPATVRAEVRTEHASRYLQQLCKHWSHRFPVAFDPAHGTIGLNGADLALDADPAGLVMTLSAADVAALPRFCEVVSEHLKRFAFREDLDVAWRRSENA